MQNIFDRTGLNNVLHIVLSLKEASQYYRQNTKSFMHNSQHHFNTDFLPFENGIILSIKGELDASSALMAINVMENIVAAGVGHLILDCTKLTNISSAGIGVILSVYHLSLEKNTLLTLFGLQPQIVSLFEALGIDNILAITQTIEEAITPAAVARLA